MLGILAKLSFISIKKYQFKNETKNVVIDFYLRAFLLKNAA